MHHSIVAREPGRFKAWPANGGLWAWGDEVLALYYDGTEDFSDPDGHSVDQSLPLWTEQARSFDGGQTWTIERDPLAHPDVHTPAPLSTPLDFSDPNLILCFKMSHWERGVSFLYASTDRGRRWQVPFTLPLWGRETVNARNCYVTRGERECLAFLSGGEVENRREDGYETFAVRTADGGLTWQNVSRVGGSVGMRGGTSRAFAIMPSVVETASGTLVCLTRCLDTTVLPPCWIAAWRSDDAGVSWTFQSRIETPGKSSPPALTALKDGRLVVTYGYRAVPFGIRARTSADQGRTWSDEIILRDDGGNWDLGYTRNVLLDSGDLLTVYYFNTHASGDRRIETTRWRP